MRASKSFLLMLLPALALLPPLQNGLLPGEASAAFHRSDTLSPASRIV